ncbi:hypothetical protein GOBAR_DD33745 [Gossypium barbadense]|nr:hypothetical protein GOBAR_DD33745 [Gossypium barbadense]
MVRNKSACVVLLFSLFLSFGLLCSAKDFPGRRGDDDPSKRYEDCRRRCEWDTRGQKEQQQCEESCKSQYGEKGQQQRHRPEDPQRRYEECQQECRQQEERQQPQCQQRCLKRFEQEQQQSQRQFQECQQHCHQQEQRPEKEATISFQSRFREEHGNFRVLQRFASRHPILRGINEFRLSILEANPNTFVLPHHCDAEKIYLVTNGRGTLTFLTHENKESYNIVPGLVVNVPAGSTVYLVNQDNKEKLIIAVLHRPVNNPGQFEEFFPAGSQRPQSYLRAFSREILEPAFNGSIFVPHYNSKATFVILVNEGNGYAEMERRSGQYRKIRSQLSRGDIFVVPANFPVTFVASQNQNLRMTGFGLYNQNINPDHNQRIFVAGKINHVRQWDSQAKELAFGVSSSLSLSRMELMKSFLHEDIRRMLIPTLKLYRGKVSQRNKFQATYANLLTVAWSGYRSSYFPGRRSEDDPQQRYEDCRKRCQLETRGQTEQDKCEDRCETQLKEEQQRDGEDPQRRYQDCRQHCQQEERRLRPHCEQSCREQYEKQQQQQPDKRFKECQQRCQWQEQGPERKQQCVKECREQSFQERFREEHGNFRVLQRFAAKHHLLRGINEFRIAILEANPNTFVLPHHCDAEKIYVVTNGRGTITFVTHENKESYNVVPGVVVRIPAGSTVYLANQDNREKLTIAVLHRPVNNPGQFQKFFPAGQENPQSYLRIFSREILEAVFNTRSEQLDELFGGRQSHRRQQGQGMFRKASQEQIRALSQGATSPRGKGSEGYAFNLLSQTPRYSNQNGRFYEACPRNFQQQLREVDSSVVAFEINKGSIFVPHYNSKATFVVLVTEGNGHVEMRVRAQLSTGDLFVVPAGHPVTFVASQNEDLGLLGFGLYNGQDNKRIFVAGKTNNVRQWDRQAKELAFGVESRLVDEVFNNNPQESYFVSGQSRRGFDERRGSNNPLSPFLDFARLF